MIRALGVAACAAALWAAPCAYAANGELAAVARGATDTLVTLNPDGTGLRPLYAAPAGVTLARPAWAPDGDRLAFVAGGTVEVYDLASGAVTPVIAGTDPAWTPDGARIELRQGTALLSVRPDGGDPRRLGATLPPATTAAGFSPDGARIAYLVPPALYVAPVAGGAATLATTGVRGAPAWTPDSIRLAVSAAGRIFSLVPAGPLSPISPAGGLDTAPGWSPDATQVVYLHEQDTAELRIASASGATTRTVIAGVFDDPAWQPCTPGRTVSCTSVAPPVCPPPASVTTQAGVAVTLPPPACTDPALRPLSISVAVAPAHGALAGGRYTPAAGFTGEDAVTYRVSNGAVATLLRQAIFVVPLLPAPVPAIRRAPYLDAVAMPRLNRRGRATVRAWCDAPCTVALRLVVRERGGKTRRSRKLVRTLPAGRVVTLRLEVAHRRRARIAWIRGTVRGAAGSRRVTLPVRLPQ
jgi:Big-like domain-containing protein/WD40 repeat protein